MILSNVYTTREDFDNSNLREGSSLLLLAPAKPWTAIYVYQCVLYVKARNAFVSACL